MDRRRSPRSPGRVMPRSAFRFAPSMYTWTPLAWHISVISRIRDSKSPSVFGIVIMKRGHVLVEVPLEVEEVHLAVRRRT